MIHVIIPHIGSTATLPRLAMLPQLSAARQPDDSIDALVRCSIACSDLLADSAAAHARETLGTFR